MAIPGTHLYWVERTRIEDVADALACQRQTSREQPFASLLECPSECDRVDPLWHTIRRRIRGADIPELDQAAGTWTFPEVLDGGEKDSTGMLVYDDGGKHTHTFPDNPPSR